MKTVPTCEGKVIGAILYDNIGLVSDLTNLIRKFQKERDFFMKDEDNIHKKMIADFIEVAYKMEVSKNVNKPFSEFYNDGLWTDSPFLNFDNHSTTPSKVRNFNIDEEVYKKNIFKKHAPEKLNLINEEARKHFLKYYEEKLQEFNKKIVQCKNDRKKHLDYFLKPIAPFHLGSSFLHYDRDYDFETEMCTNGDESSIVSKYFFGQSFLSCIDGMMDEPKEVEYIPNKEHALFGDYVEDKDSFIWEIFKWSRENKVDSLASIIFGNDFAAVKRVMNDKSYDNANSNIQQEYKNSQARIAELKVKYTENISKTVQLKKDQMQVTDAYIKEKNRNEIIRLEKEKIALNKELEEKEKKLNKLDKKQKHPAEPKSYKKLQEHNRLLNEYNQKKMGINIMQYILNAEDLNAGLRSIISNHVETIMSDKEGNANLSLWEKEVFTPNRKRVRKLGVTQEIYDKVILKELANGVHFDNRLFTSKADKEKIKNSGQSIDGVETKQFILISVDDSEYEALKSKIKILEKHYAEESDTEKKLFEEKKDKYKKDKARIEQQKEVLNKKYKKRIENIPTIETEELKKQYDKAFEELQEELRELNTKTSEATRKETASFTNYVKEQEEALQRDLGKFVGKFDKTVSGVMFIFTGINLWYAVKGFKKSNDSTENAIAISNFLGAVAGIITAGLQVHETYTTKPLKLSITASAGAKVSNLTYLSKVFVSKASIVGIIAGVFDAITAWGNISIQLEQNNTKSAVAYGFAGAALLGGVVAGLVAGAVSAIGAVVFFVIASLALTVYGVIQLFEAQDLAWDSMDRWLSGCFFRSYESQDGKNGKTFVGGKDKKIYHVGEVKDIDKYTTCELDNNAQKDEIIGFLSAVNEPKIEVSWDKVITQTLKDFVGLRSDIVHDGADFVLTAKFPFAVNNVKCNFIFHDTHLPLLSDGKSTPQISSSNGSFTSAPFGDTTSLQVNSKVFQMKIYDIDYLKSHLKLCLAWKNELGGESYLAQSCYDIYDDDSVKKIEGII